MPHAFSTVSALSWVAATAPLIAVPVALYFLFAHPDSQAVALSEFLQQVGSGTVADGHIRRSGHRHYSC